MSPSGILGEQLVPPFFSSSRGGGIKPILNSKWGERKDIFFGANGKNMVEITL